MEGGTLILAIVHMGPHMLCDQLITSQTPEVSKVGWTVQT